MKRASSKHETDSDSSEFVHYLPLQLETHRTNFNTCSLASDMTWTHTVIRSFVCKIFLVLNYVYCLQSRFVKTTQPEGYGIANYCYRRVVFRYVLTYQVEVMVLHFCRILATSQLHMPKVSREIGQ